MFRIRYRITEDINYLKTLNADDFDNESDIEGFFEMEFEGNIYGYYHDKPLQNGETGFDLLTNWFESLLKTCLNIKITNYIAINDIESFNTWIEFKLVSDILIVSIIKADKEEGIFEIRTEPFSNYNYGEWSNIIISFEEFKNEVISKSMQYLKEINRINMHLMYSKRIINLNNLVLEVKKILAKNEEL